MKFRNIKMHFKSLNESVKSLYGDSISSYFKFFYISFFRCNIFLIMNMNVSKYDSSIDLDGFSYSQDMEILRYFRRNKNLPKQFYMDKLKGLKRVCIVLKGEDIVHIHWVVFPGDFSRFLKISPRHAEINYVLTLPEYRNLKIFRKALCKTINSLQNDNIDRIFAVIHSQAIASIKAFESVGLKTCGRIYAFGQFNFKKSTKNLYD